MAQEEEILDTTAAVVEALRPYQPATVSPVGDEEFWSVTDAAIGNPKPNATGLRRLPGVALPVASAILCVFNPHVWPVIDVRALPLVLADLPFSHPTDRRDVYRRYVSRLDQLRRTHHPKLTIHAMDQMAYNATPIGTEWPFAPEQWGSENG